MCIRDRGVPPEYDGGAVSAFAVIGKVRTENMTVAKKIATMLCVNANEYVFVMVCLYFCYVTIKKTTKMTRVVSGLHYLRFYTIEKKKKQWVWINKKPLQIGGVFYC
jgi:hypothetical protein